jgi:hypothetical protein
MTRIEHRPASAARRWGDAVIGALLLGCAAALAWGVEPWDIKVILAMVAMLALGLHALHSAWRARPSLLSRLGPLP